MPTRIIPFVDEISLAFNPANLKEFIMHKDDAGWVKEYLKNLEKENLNMSKEQMIKDLIDKGIFAKESESFLNSMDEITLATIGAMQKDQVVVNLSKQVDEFMKKEAGKDVKIQTLEGTLGTMKTTIEKLTKDLDNNVVELMKERDIREGNEIRQMLKDDAVPGDLEKNVSMLVSLKKLSKDAYETTLAGLKAAGVAIKTAGLFNEAGSSREKDLTPEAAYQRLQDLKKEKMSKDANLTESTAWTMTLRENPKLYKEYTDSRQKRIKETITE
jgi:hypothetical protein